MLLASAAEAEKTGVGVSSRLGRRLYGSGSPRRAETDLLCRMERRLRGRKLKSLRNCAGRHVVRWAGPPRGARRSRRVWTTSPGMPRAWVGRGGEGSPAQACAVVLGSGGAGPPGLPAVARGSRVGVATAIGGEAGGAWSSGAAAGQAERAEASGRLERHALGCCVSVRSWQRRP